MDLIEKIRRETNWFQKARLVRDYHALMIETKGKKRGDKWTMQDTANLLEYSVGYVSESITLASHSELSRLSRSIALRALRNGNHV